MMQMSDWEKRPLSAKQLEYAALDAFVLLQLFDVIFNPNTGLSRAQLHSCLYSHCAQGRQPGSKRNLLSAAHSDQQLSSNQQPSEKEPVPLPAMLPVSQLSSPSTGSSHSLLPSTTTARTFHSQAAREPSSASSVAAYQQGIAQQEQSGGISRVPDGPALQECLRSHGLQSAWRRHSSLGAG